MSASADPREWLYLRMAFGAVALIVIAVLVGWKVNDIVHPRQTRLELTVACLTERGIVPIIPTGDPLAESASAGALEATIEGNDVTVALAGSQKQAVKIEGYYRAVGGDLQGRLEHRDKTVYLWAFPSSPTQRQAMYDCQF